MSKTTKHILVFLPALVLVGLFFFIRVVQYEPLYPKIGPDEHTGAMQVPIFANDPIIGSERAPITLIAFEDFGCEHCMQQERLLSELIEKHPTRVKVVFKSLSVTRFPQDTRLAHQYAFCIHEQKKFSEFKDYAFANYQNLSEVVLNSIVDSIGADKGKIDACLTSGRADTYLGQVEALASGIGIQSVPSIFYQNKQLPLPDTLAGWEQLLGL